MLKTKILIIKLSALGDFVQATGAFKAIREHHKNDHITLLTTKNYLETAQNCPWFDEVMVDERPKTTAIFKWFRLIRKLTKEKYNRVYDLQTSGRSSRYFYLMKLFGYKGEWSGIAKGCSHPHLNPQRNFMHTIDRQKEQLQEAGIKTIYKPDVSWLSSDIDKFNLGNKLALIVAGGSPHRPQKRWLASNYAKLAVVLAEKGITPVLLGSESEKEQIAIITKHSKDAVSLMGKTSFADIAGLAKKALFAIGNDTGPMHLIAACQTPCFVLFSKDSTPELCKPFGDVQILRKDDLRDLSFEEVLDFLNKGISFS